MVLDNQNTYIAVNNAQLYNQNGRPEQLPPVTPTNQTQAQNENNTNSEQRQEYIREQYEIYELRKQNQLAIEKNEERKPIVDVIV